MAIFAVNKENFPQLFEDELPGFTPPKSLWVEAKEEKAIALLNQLPTKGLGIVGTRKPLQQSTYLVQNSLYHLRHSGLIILSGLARGIDTEAHRFALINELPTIAILGCGLHHQYPPENEELRAQILERGGLILSEFEPDQAPRPHLFAIRNRLIAAYSQATWVVQAGMRSGATITGTHALKIERDLYVTPCFPGSPLYHGNQILLEQNAGARAYWTTESFSQTWIELFSKVQFKDETNVTFRF
jgi:DNA processing protein